MGRINEIRLENGRLIKFKRRSKISSIISWLNETSGPILTVAVMLSFLAGAWVTWYMWQIVGGGK